MRIVEFAYDIGDLVNIADYPDIQGRIVGMAVRIEGTVYCVRWWQDGQRYEDWLHDWELKSAKPHAESELSQ